MLDTIPEAPAASASVVLSSDKFVEDAVALVAVFATVKVKAEVPVFVICSALFIGNTPEVSAPNDKVEGTTVTLVCEARSAFTSPPPVASMFAAFPESSLITLWEPVFTKADLICAAE